MFILRRKRQKRLGREVVKKKSKESIEGEIKRKVQEENQEAKKGANQRKYK